MAAGASLVAMMSMVPLPLVSNESVSSEE
jgi:hypothetical protein